MSLGIQPAQLVFGFLQSRSSYISELAHGFESFSWVGHLQRKRTSANQDEKQRLCELHEYLWTVNHENEFTMSLNSLFQRKNCAYELLDAALRCSSDRSTSLSLWASRTWKIFATQMCILLSFRTCNQLNLTENASHIGIMQPTTIKVPLHVTRPSFSRLKWNASQAFARRLSQRTVDGYAPGDLAVDLRLGNSHPRGDQEEPWTQACRTILTEWSTLENVCADSLPEGWQFFASV